MSEFKNKSLTTKGMELVSKALSGGKIEFTRIEMGSGTFSGDISNVEGLVEVKQNLKITNIVRKGGQVTLSAILKIEDITTEYDWSEIGVYAKGADEVEVLYMYGHTENTSFISKTSLNEKLINVTVLVSNVADVTATIDGSIVYLTREALEDHNNSETSHNDIRELINQLKLEVDSLDVSWEGISGKPETFPPATHQHTKSQITDFPTSLPANGGNADTVDGKHATDFASSTGFNDNFGVGKYLTFNSYGGSTHGEGTCKSYYKAVDKSWRTEFSDIYLGSNRIYHTGNKPTKADVGLGNVPNYPSSGAVNDASNNKLATSGAVKLAYDKAVEAYNLANSTKCYKPLVADTVVLVTSKTFNGNSPIADFIPKYNGWVNVSITASRTNASYTTYLKFINNVSKDDTRSPSFGNLMTTPIGATCTSLGNGEVFVGAFTTGESYSVSIPVMAGQMVRFFSNSGITVTKLSIGYSEVTL